ncbi:MAG TPA: amidase [Sandaracinaceae bacterium LLY-WYZ-13_1]|nr:amidase [Sandaracinaceae bacterium LLY-WYZ-13_1]
MHPYVLKSATELAALIRAGETTSLEVVDRHLERLREVNPILNAVVRVRLREAREEAREADRRLAEEGPDGLGPLHGVPCTIKESFELEGMPHSAGLVSREGRRGARDAITVRRLREAGAIPIGVTNVSELLMWMESNNRVYGRTNNPYDPSRIVGGSSGGEGASVGAGIAPFGLGADIGGSIRMPAFFNGVFGHKPSSGLVPNTGQWPIAENQALTYLSTGPLARRAEDLWPLLRVLAGPDGECAAAREIALGDPGEVQVSSLRVLHVPDNGVTSVHPDLRDAQQRAADALAEAGARVARRRFEGLRRSLHYWGASMSAAGGTPFGVLMGDGRRKAVLPELGKWLLRRSDHTLPALMLAALERVPEALPDRTSGLVREAAALRETLSEALGDDGVMLYPSYARPAPRHYAPMLRPFDWVYTAIINVMGFPSTQVPLGLNRAGVPLGVQVVAAHGRDHLSLAVARALERAFGGWVPPPTRRRFGVRRTRIPGAP